MKKDLKFQILSEGLTNGVSLTCTKYNISRTIYYRWLKRYKTLGIDGLDTIKKDFVPINKTCPETEKALLNLIKEYPHYGPRALKYLFEELGYTLSESAIYNMMKRNNLTHKDSRIKFAQAHHKKLTTPLPSLHQLQSGECWIFWITDYGHYKNIGNIYAYNLYDLKSRIACTRLYDKVSLSYFEEILAAVAMPVAKTLDLNIHYLCLFKDCKIIQASKKNFKAKLSKIILNHGFDFKIHIFLPSNSDLTTIRKLKKQYSEDCASFLMPHLQGTIDFNTLKTHFQEYLRNYNMKELIPFDVGDCSPIDYHIHCTHKKLILPIWAYIDREY